MLAGSGAEGGGHEGATHFPNLIEFIYGLTHDGPVHGDPAILFEGAEAEVFGIPLDLTLYLSEAANIFFFLLALVLVVSWAKWTASNGKERPENKFYIFSEWFFESLRDFFGSVVGKEDIDSYFGITAGLFIFILFMNLFGLVALGKPPTAVFATNIALAAIVFFVTEITEIQRNGLGGYLKHLVGHHEGQPVLMTALMSPLMVPLHFIEKIVRPVSLALRLFGNMFSKEVLLGVFAGMLIQLSPTSVIGILYVPMLLLAVIFSVVQALIFSLLAAVYIQLALPDDHEHELESAH